MNTRTDARRNLSLRKALDRARESLLRRDLEAARRSILKAGEQGPLPVRPTRLLWEVTFRWLKASRQMEGSPLNALFNAAKLDRELDAADKLRKGKKLDQAYKRYQKALAVCPLSPSAIHRIGLTCADSGDLTEAAHWLKLVPEILDGERRRGPTARGLVADSYLALARIELERGHRARSATLALKALDAKPDYPAAREFIWDLERAVNRPKL